MSILGNPLIVVGNRMDSILNHFAYTGKMDYSLKFMDGVLYHLLTFKTSGTLTVTDSFKGDIFMSGAGGAGEKGSTYTSSIKKSRGGGGGYTLNAFDADIVSGDIIIGDGGKGGSVSTDGGETSYGIYTAAGGKSGDNGANGGSGGGGTPANDPEQGKGQGSSTRPFLSQDMNPTSAGGGSGALRNKDGVKGGTDGGDGEKESTVTSDDPVGGDGGEYGGGGGAGDDASTMSASVQPGVGGAHGLDGVGNNSGKGGGYAPGGGGGGGAQAQSTGNIASFGGDGAPGIVMIRIAV